MKIIVGFKNIEGLIFKDEFDRWKEKFDVLITLDNNEGAKDMNQGMVAKYIPDLFLSEDTSDYEFVVVGPPIMMHFTCLEVLKRNIPKEQIWVSFERRMSCAVGKCGHCKIDETYICLEGPVFNYSFAQKLLD